MTEAAREFRLSWLKQIIKATEASTNFRQSSDAIEAEAKLLEGRFAHVPTEDLNELFDLGQKCLAESIDDFLQVWAIEQESRRRETEIAKRRREAGAEQARINSPHPQRDRVFNKWGLA